MNSRSETLGKEFDAVHADIGATIAQIGDDQWQAVAPADGRQINVLLDHAVGTNVLVAQMIEGPIAGGSLPDITGEDVEHGNQQHMGEATGVTRAEVLTKLDQAQAACQSLAPKLTDAVLDRTEFFGPFGGDVSVETIAQVILIDHAREHLGSVQAALAG